jgi:hypothetical protein
MPDHALLNDQVKKLERVWAKNSQKLLKEIAKATKLSWQEKEIDCYVTDGVRPYSDPLTLNMRSDLDTIAHELIHRILSEPENWQKIKKNWLRLMKKYEEEPDVVGIHVVVHAVHAQVLYATSGEKRLPAIIQKTRDPNYIRAWELAEQEGYDAVVTQLTKGL